MRWLAFVAALGCSSTSGGTQDGPVACPTDQDPCPGMQVCDGELKLCTSPAAPCRGLSCGGSERGTCEESGCVCNDGYSLLLNADLCCALEGADELCDGIDPAPGRPGGLCMAPNGSCDAEATECDATGNYCFRPDAPCFGFRCGGAERGVCTPLDGRPACTCAEGFENEPFDLYCCPLDGTDPACR